MSLEQEFRLDAARRNLQTLSREQLIGSNLNLLEKYMTLLREVDTLRSQLKKHNSQELH